VTDTPPDAGGLIATLTSEPRLLRVRPAVQQYAWGGYDFIPGLLGVANPQRLPHAELWIGSHPVAPARVEWDRVEYPLDRVAELAPEWLTGARGGAPFSPELPYLLKVLDVRAMLSIQAHPDLAQAREGFARENAAGVPLGAATRNYRDPNHKREAGVALAPFWLLYGFKPPAAMRAAVASEPAFAELLGDSVTALEAVELGRADAPGVFRQVYTRVMTATAAETDRVAAALAASAEREAAGGRLDRHSGLYWVARSLDWFPPSDGHFDRGILSIPLMNVLRLAPGEGVFLETGVPHAYLEGVAVEVMSNSDNVLRGGLTSKHVDAGELLRVLTFQPTEPRVMAARTLGGGESVYETPAEEFSLRRLDLAGGQTAVLAAEGGADSLLVLEGSIRIESGAQALALDRGGVALSTCGLRYTVTALAPSTIFRVIVP
jgi:mannose-6-phosphate isomerase